MGDSLTDLGVGEETTVGTGDGSVAVGHLLQGVGTGNLNSLHAGTSGVLGEVLDGEFASGGTLSSELVALGSVRRLSLVGDTAADPCSEDQVPARKPTPLVA